MRFLIPYHRVLTPLAFAALVFAAACAAQVAKRPAAGPATTNGLVPQQITPRDTPALPLTGKNLTVPARGIVSSSLATASTAGATLTNWTGAFVSGGVAYPYTMLGTDPALGSATTWISTVMIPLKLVFSNGMVLNADAPVWGDSRSATTLTAQSPLFNPHNFTPGGTSVGSTQYIDAFQRANFWSLVTTTSPDYHVKFHIIKTTPVQTLNVPAFFGYATSGGPGKPIGYVNSSWWDGQLGQLLYRLHISASTLPIFLNYNVVLEGGILGYHTAFGDPPQVYLTAGFYDQGILSYGGDIVVLSHEMGETTDDPFVNNIVPSGGLLEVGDPVTDVSIGQIVLNNYIYHPEDLVFLPWFSCAIPSFSVNGWYTFGNYFPGPACEGY